MEKIRFLEEGNLGAADLRELHKTCGILSKKNFRDWDFDKIGVIIENLRRFDWEKLEKSDRPKKDFFMDLCEKRFFKKLLKTYMPSKHEFIDLPWKPSNFVVAEVGYSLLAFLLKVDYGIKLLGEENEENFFVVNKSFMAEMQYIIENDLKHLKTFKKRLNDSIVAAGLN